MYPNQKIFIILVLVFASIIVNGQASKNDDAKETVLKTKVIKMPKYPIADFPKKSAPVADIQVIQFVRDSVRLGYVLKGIANQVAYIQPEKPLTILLQDHIEKMYKSDYKKEGSKMLWVIKELRIGERTGFTEFSYLKLKADSYISMANNKYALFYTLDTVLATESGGDVTEWHGQELEDGLKLLLKETLKKTRNLNSDSVGFSMEEIIKMSMPEINYPILNNTVYAEGAYKNFEEFLQNKPSITDYSPVTVKKKKNISITGFKSNNGDSIKIWGLCKNGEIYKFVEDQLVPIEKNGDGFIVSYYVAKANLRNNGIFIGSLLGGLAGGLISMWIADKAPQVKSIPHLTKSKKQPDATIIDMETGELSF